MALKRSKHSSQWFIRGSESRREMISLVHSPSGERNTDLVDTTRTETEPAVVADTSTPSTEPGQESNGAVESAPDYAPEPSERPDPSTILVSGDLHGDPQHTLYIFQAALNNDADAIIQVGDFGYWEHVQGGDAFLDLCSDLATQNDLPLYWIDGNHENHTWLRRLYGPGGSRHKPTPEGFWEIRPGVYYVPRGTRWVWSDRHLMGLGGAYSVDKFYRLRKEREAHASHVYSNKKRREVGAPTKPFDPELHQRWWHEEELTDSEVAAAISDPTPIDILFTHDKPRASTPGWNRKAYPDCLPNQDKIQTVVDKLHPQVVIHGHLHYRYTDYIHNGTEGGYAQVEGLSCNTDAQENDKDPDASWLLLRLGEDES